MSAPAVTEPALPGARALIEKVMRAGRSVAAECPLVFEGPLGPRRPGRVVALDENGAVRSACALLPRDFIVGERRLRLGLIGYVVTDPDARGRGHATRVLDAAEAALAQRGCVASLLWADDPAFYERLGYRRIGSELDFHLSFEALAALPRWASTRPLDPAADAAAVHALAAARPVGVERTLDETRALLGLPGLHARVALRGDRVVGFAIEGKGCDLAGAIHEWGGETLAVLGLAAELAEPHLSAGRPTYLIAPCATLEVPQALLDLGLEAGLGVLGMGRLLDPAAARAALGPAGADPTASDAELLEALLPAGSALESSSPFASLFAWGLDSI